MKTQAITQAVEIEVDGPHNECFRFRPLQRSIRGRFDLNRIGEPLARMKSSEYPLPIPGQKLGIDDTGSGYLIEPLHDEEHKPIREKIEKAGMSLEPKYTEYDGIDLPTWYFWIKQAVEAGLAKITYGELPVAVDGKPRKNFVLADPEPSTTDKLTEAIQKQNQLFAKLLKQLAEK